MPCLSPFLDCVRNESCVMQLFTLEESTVIMGLNVDAGVSLMCRFIPHSQNISSLVR